MLSNYNVSASDQASSTLYASLRFPTPDPQFGMSSSPSQGMLPTLFSIERLELKDLMGNWHVQELFKQNQHLLRQADSHVRQLESNTYLHQKIDSLHLEVNELRQKVTELQSRPIPFVAAPNANVQMTSSSTSSVAFQPDMYRSSIRPLHYPESILWAFEDCVKQNLVKDANKSRPNMRMCIRDENGQMIQRSAYKTIKNSAHMFIDHVLSGLPTPTDPAARNCKKTKTYYRRFYPQKYQEVLVKLEASEPLLMLCAPNWKADHIVQQTLQWLSSKKGETSGQKLGKKLGKRTQRERDGSCSANESSESETDNDNPHNISTSHPPCLTLSEQLSTLETMKSSGLVSNVSPSGPVAASDKDTNLTTSSLSLAPTAQCHPPTIDVGYIHVDRSVPSLRNELIHLIPTVACSADLLDAMEKNPDYFNGQPSMQLSALISAVEAANPNVEDLSEEESNSSWGHRQLSGKWRDVLTSWESVGNCNIACQLIAAVVKTCKVARQLCFERKLKASSYLCDAYLQEIIEKLWDSWKDAGGPIVKGKAVDRSSADSNNPITLGAEAADVGAAAAAVTVSTDTVSTPSNIPSKLEIEKLLSSLLIADLKSWVEKFGVGLTSNKRTPAKEEYRTAILSSPLSVSDSGYVELQTLSHARKALRKTKLASVAE